MPLASEEKHNELINRIVNPTGTFGKAGGHASPDTFVKLNANVALPRSQYLSNQEDQLLPEIIEAREAGGKAAKKQPTYEELRDIKRD